MNKSVLSIVVMSALTYIPMSHSSEESMIPEEFMSMFSADSAQFSVQVSGQERGIKVSMKATPFEVRLDASEQDELTEYLKKQNLSDQAVENIINALFVGVENNPVCTGLVRECQMIPEFFAFGYDYENKQLTLFVNNSLLANQKPQELHDSHNEVPGLINSINASVSVYQGNASNLMVRNNSILGLPYGNITSSIYANTDSNTDELDVEEFAYNYEWGRQRVQVGHYEYGLSKNTTSLLDISSSESFDAIALSSSKNLVQSKARTQRQLHYFLPGEGIIEIFRDQKKIYNKNVHSGQQSVNFSDLPSGNYQVEVVVTSQGKEVLRERRQIYNTATFELEAGDVDYALITGQFNDKDANSAKSLTLNSEGFFDGRLSYQWLDNMLFGSRVLTTSDATLAEVGVSQDILDMTSISAQYAWFDNDATYLNANGTILGFSLSYENYSLDNTDYALNNYMLGNSGYQRFTLSRGMALFGGSGYVTYIDNEADDTLLGGDYVDQTDYWSVTVGYSRPFVAGSTLSLSVTWQDSGEGFEGDDSEWYSSLLWQIPLGGDWEVSSSLSSDVDGIAEFRNSIAHDFNGKNYRGRSEAGVSYNTNEYQEPRLVDASLSGNYRNDEFALDGYAFVKSDGTRSMNLGLASTQIFDGDDVYLTSEKGEAYVVFSADGDDGQDSHLGMLTVSENGARRQNKNVDTPRTVMPIRKYAQYDVDLDTDSSNYITNDKKSRSAYAFPGSVLPLSVGLTKIKTFISSFENIRNEPVGELNCIGDGCVGVETIAEGVFKVSVIVGAEYQLTSIAQTCVTPSLDRRTSNIVNVGLNYCLPGIDNENVQLALLQPLLIDDSTYYFVGVYKTNEELTGARRDVMSIGLETIEKQVGQRHYLYAKSEQVELTAMQRNELEALMRYAMKSFENEKWVMWR